jgi:Holliday junction resolvasome RuvABC DNA-binding subunit
MSEQQPTNEEIGDLLDRIADLLEHQEANPFRVRAYRNGAESARSAEQSLAKMVEEEDQERLQALSDIGEGLARVITTYVETGRSNLLDRLEGEVSPIAVFTDVPGIGKELAQRIVDTLDIHTLEALERAAHNSNLSEVRGFGPERIHSVKVSLAGMLSRSAQRRAEQRTSEEGKEQPAEPSVETLLEVDTEYRERAKAGELKKIAPRRFNPEDKAWLPIMHTEQDGWEFTALYSNTARAHDLDKTHDWVVLYYENGRKGQATVVTESSGPLEGKRVVRGREAECRRYYGEKDE